jgi:Ni,Fe-hydrogenase III large subunit/Ni,Fe-hydrogenase III component G
VTSPAIPTLALEPAGWHRRAGVVQAAELVDAATALLAQGMRLAHVSGHDDGDQLRVVYLFTSGPPDTRVELHLIVDPANATVPTLSGISFPAGRFEREIQDLFGIVPVGHPQPRRLVLHQHWPEDWYPMRRGSGDPPPMVTDAGAYPFVPVEGTGVYEIPVGPVHAGLIEPGHFRFWVVGETILRMKARLWFVHKGIERLFQGRDPYGGVELAERISGDTAVGHTLAYCQAVEDAWHVEVPAEAMVLRGTLLELERLYNHTADIGALCNDVGFGVANAWALSLREYLLQLNARVTGHRLLRGGVIPGGARIHYLPTNGDLSEISQRFEELIGLITSSALVMERFTGTAVLDEAHARDLGVVGVAGRASGLAFDVRQSHPSVVVSRSFSPALRTEGDVKARFDVRVEEARTSLSLVGHFIQRVGSLDAVTVTSPAQPDRSASGVGIIEAWRGAVVHRVELDHEGRLTRVKVVDPSFHNWPALPVSLADTIVPDFPLANKSFNLSYAGNDL